VRSTGFSTGVAKKELGIANLMAEKAAKLDRDTFGVAVGQEPWQRRLEEIGSIKPLAFGQFGEMGPGLEALLASMAKRGADEMLSPSTDLCCSFDVRTCRGKNRTPPGAGPSKAAHTPKHHSKHPGSRPKRGGAGHPTSVAQIGVGGL
jgi:hypothetical protein